ncbi:MAG TPA: transposase [Gaiellaceae bacterium]|nr:transposase [Gaiellaceae bacterium]
MGHPLRRLDPEAIYHVISRGNNGGWIVRDAIDRAAFRSRLDCVAKKYDWEGFAWCLMTTHAHFVLRAPEECISLGMQALNSRHAQCVNRRHGRTGHLFQNRFFSVEVATDAHLVSSIAYVNRNPLAAYAVEAAEDWRDSSYRAMLGLEPAPSWLAADEILELFGRTQATARAELASLVSSGRVLVSDTLEEVRRFELYGLAAERVAMSG